MGELSGKLYFSYVFIKQSGKNQETNCNTVRQGQVAIKHDTQVSGLGNLHVDIAPERLICLTAEGVQSYRGFVGDGVFLHPYEHVSERPALLTPDTLLLTAVIIFFQISSQLLLIVLQQPCRIITENLFGY